LEVRYADVPVRWRAEALELWGGSLRLGAELQDRKMSHRRKEYHGRKLRRESFGKREIAGNRLGFWLSDVWKCRKKEDKTVVF
jgi:hypothetical protein